jgi:streptogramin lyase
VEYGSLTAGPDGNLWFIESSTSVGGLAIGRITPSGAVTEFPLPTGYGVEYGSLTAGPDGNLWFEEAPIISGYHGSTLGMISAIGRITPSGALSQFPLPTVGSYGFQEDTLTVAPDGNLWFPDGHVIGRITPSGALTQFPLPAGYDGAGSLTVGPDGNLWFLDWPNGSASAGIGRVDLPPRVTGVIAIAHPSKRITSILIGFDEALDPGTAENGGFYSLAAGIKKHHKLMFSRGVKIASVSYDGTAHTVTLKLARPHKGKIQVTVRAGIVAADGMSSPSDFTAVVT